MFLQLHAERPFVFLSSNQVYRLFRSVKRVPRLESFGSGGGFDGGYRSAFEADHWNIARFVVIVSTNNV